MEVVNVYFAAISADDYRDRRVVLEHNWMKLINIKGDYFKK